MVQVSLDTSELATLAADLGKVPGRVVPEARKVVLKAAIQVKAGMRKDFSGHKGFQHVPRKISYDAQGLEAEVGVDKGGQGNLANIMAYGGSRGGPYVDHTAALAREMPNFERYLAEAAMRAFR